MHKKYFVLLKAFFLPLRKKKGRFFQKTKIFKKSLMCNYKVKKNPISFTLKFISLSLWLWSENPHNSLKPVDLMQFVDTFVEFIDFNSLKFVF